jgi:D-serine deaminase-like pyridoxal phosphate-dependent protein
MEQMTTFMIEIEQYLLRDPASLITPCLLVYPKLIRANIAESIRVAGSSLKLRPHVKTHKTPEIVGLNQAAGINKFKCATLSEAHMLGCCGAADVLIAYPQVGPAIARLIEIMREFPQTRYSTVVDNGNSLQQLDAAVAQAGLTMPVLLDLDTGMHRTGIPVGPAAQELYLQIGQCRALSAGGMHLYDGQNHQPNLQDRRTAVNALWQTVLQMVEQLTQAGAAVPKVVCGGTPTFPVFASLQPPIQKIDIECSPGTCVLSDFNYGRDYADMSGFQPAAVLMTRVISRHHTNRVTVDLGYKAVASDPPAGRRCHFLNLPEAKEIQHSEEHLVLESPAANHLQVGDVLYAIPAHVCPTVALHSHLIVIEEGAIIDRWQVTARDRLVG